MTTLSEDIQETQEEYIAYKNIALGFKKLSQLDAVNSSKYDLLYEEYFLRQKECGLVLDQLYKLSLIPS